MENKLSLLGLLCRERHHHQGDFHCGSRNNPQTIPTEAALPLKLLSSGGMELPLAPLNVS